MAGTALSLPTALTCVVPVPFSFPGCIAKSKTREAGHQIRPAQGALRRQGPAQVLPQALYVGGVDAPLGWWPCAFVSSLMPPFFYVPPQRTSVGWTCLKSLRISRVLGGSKRRWRSGGRPTRPRWARDGVGSFGAGVWQACADGVLMVRLLIFVLDSSNQERKDMPSTRD